MRLTNQLTALWQFTELKLHQLTSKRATRGIAERLPETGRMMRQIEVAKRTMLRNANKKHRPTFANRSPFTSRHYPLFRQPRLVKGACLFCKYLHQVFKPCHLPFMKTMIQANRGNRGFLI